MIRYHRPDIQKTVQLIELGAWIIPPPNTDYYNAQGGYGDGPAEKLQDSIFIFPNRFWPAWKSQRP